MAETALIGVDIDLSLVNKRLAETGELTAKEARHMQRELTQAYKKAARESEHAAKLMARAQSKAARDAEREAKRAANAIKSSVNEQTSAIKGLSTAAFGGMAGDLFDVADAAGGASLGLGAIGVGLGALAVGLPMLKELAAATLELGRSALEAREEIEKEGLSIADLISPAAATALDDYEQSQRDLGVAIDIATVQLSMGLLPNLRELDTMLIGMTPHAELAGEAISLTVDAAKGAFVAGLTQQLNQFAPGAGNAAAAAMGLGKAYLDAEGEALKLEVATQRVEDRDKALRFELGQLLDAQKLANQEEAKSFAIKQRKAAADAAAKAAADAHKAAAAANRETVDESTEATETYAEAMAKLEAAMNGAQSAIGITDEQSKQFNETLRAQNEAIAGEQGPTPLQQMGADMMQAGEAALTTAEALTPIMGNLQQLAAIEQRQHEDRIRQLRDQRAASRDTYQTAAAEYESSRADMTATERIAQEDYLARLAQSEAAKRKQMREIELEERKAAMEAYKRQKALQLVQIAIDTARNAVALTPAFAYAGPYAPLIATGIASAPGGTAAAIVASPPAPAFHFGTSAAAGAGAQNPAGIVGAEVPAVLEAGEGVISRRGMAAPGMAELVQMANDGRAPSERSSITDAEADMLAQRLNRPYAPNIRGRAEAGRNTFYRGR